MSASVKLVMNNASIEYDDSKLELKDLEDFVSEAGFESLGIDNFEKEEKKKSNEKFKIWGISIISLLVLTSVVLFFGRDILKNGYKNLKHGTPNMDTLVTIGVLASYIYSIYSTIQIISGNHDFVES